MPKPNRIKWATADTCEGCGCGVMVFELFFHKGEEWFGHLVCPNCGHRESAVVLTYQVPVPVVEQIAGVRL